MVSTKELIKMARKWNKIAAIGRKRIASPRSNNPMMANADNSNKSSVVGKGYFVAYAMDKKPFLIPLAFLNNSIFQALLKMSEEEFGLSSNRPLTFLCDSVIMSYIVLLVRRGLAKDLEKAVVNSITSNSCSPCTEEEFGLPGDGPIKLPCDSVVMNYIVSIVKRGLAKDMEKAVLNSIPTYRCSSDVYFNQVDADQQSLCYGFQVNWL
ncbi:hypothetical protein Goarm_020582 [Gossypium armourianum]|uniref:Auxin-responsive protein SAUR68-like n=1 Tax=Gossypium armourianum TaxID=34283 RepID=A0A7J9IP16_9ROSI|nr:hypothetical protein [Gossypium armourianum]